MAELGIDAGATTPLPRFIASLTDRVREEFRDDASAGPFTEIASLAMRRALAESASSSQRSMFDQSVEDLQQTLRRFSTKAQFAALSHRYFGDFVARTLVHFIDREVPNNVGSSRLTTMEAARSLTSGVEAHARETAVILRDFAGGWYSKNQWESQGRISRDESDRFVAHALRKLRAELSAEAARQ